MLTPQQKEQIASKGNEFLLFAYSDFSRGYPGAEKALGMTLTVEQRTELLISSFKTVLQKTKETDPTVLTDQHLRAILLTPPTTFDWIQRMLWMETLKTAEAEINQSQPAPTPPQAESQTTHYKADAQKIKVRIGGFAIGPAPTPPPPPPQKKKHWWQR